MQTVIEALHDERLFANSFDNLDDWHNWTVFLRALQGMSIDDPADLKLFRECTGLEKPPGRRSREAYVISGRRSGKSTIASMLAVWLATCRDWREVLSTGEIGRVFLVANDRQQARNLKNYIMGFLNKSPVLRDLIKKETIWSIELTNGVEITVATKSYRTLRGYSLIACIMEEIAFYRSDEFAQPDKEILAAVLPGLGTIKDSLCLGISSAYRRAGILFDKHKKHWGQSGGPLIWQSSTLTMNKTFDPAIIEAAKADDLAAATSDYDSTWRQDLEGFISLEILERAAAKVPPRASESARYFAHVDVSGGQQDSFAAAVSHLESKFEIVIDEVFEKQPPFQPQEVCDEVSALLGRYGIHKVQVDRSAIGWVKEAFQKNGISTDINKFSTSETYREFLPILSNEMLTMPNNKRLVNQFANLERRALPGGGERISHPTGCHDDLAAAVSGAALLAWQKRIQRKGRVHYPGRPLPPREEEYDFPPGRKGRVFVGATSGRSHLKYKSYKEQKMFDYDYSPSERFTLNFLDHRMPGSETDKGLKKRFSEWVSFVADIVKDDDEISEKRLEQIAAQLSTLESFQKFNSDIKKRDRQGIVLSPKILCEKILSDRLRWFYNHILDAYRPHGNTAANIK